MSWRTRGEAGKPWAYWSGGASGQWPAQRPDPRRFGLGLGLLVLVLVLVLVLEEGWPSLVRLLIELMGATRSGMRCGRSGRVLGGTAVPSRLGRLWSGRAPGARGGARRRRVSVVARAGVASRWGLRGGVLEVHDGEGRSGGGGEGPKERRPGEGGCPHERKQDGGPKTETRVDGTKPSARKKKSGRPIWAGARGGGSLRARASSGREACPCFYHLILVRFAIV